MRSRNCVEINFSFFSCGWNIKCDFSETQLNEQRKKRKTCKSIFSCLLQTILEPALDLVLIFNFLTKRQ